MDSKSKSKGRLRDALESLVEVVSSDSLPAGLVIRTFFGFAATDDLIFIHDDSAVLSPHTRELFIRNTLCGGMMT